ncbi:hypothetical protein P4O66_018308, partial [Electrophorus voltai]
MGCLSLSRSLYWAAAGARIVQRAHNGGVGTERRGREREHAPGYDRADVRSMRERTGTLEAAVPRPCADNVACSWFHATEDRRWASFYKTSAFSMSVKSSGPNDCWGGLRWLRGAWSGVEHTYSADVRKVHFIVCRDQLDSLGLVEAASARLTIQWWLCGMMVKSESPE